MIVSRSQRYLINLSLGLALVIAPLSTVLANTSDYRVVHRIDGLAASSSSGCTPGQKTFTAGGQHVLDLSAEGVDAGCRVTAVLNGASGGPGMSYNGGGGGGGGGASSVRVAGTLLAVAPGGNGGINRVVGEPGGQATVTFELGDVDSVAVVVGRGGRSGACNTRRGVGGSGDPAGERGNTSRGGSGGGDQSLNNHQGAQPPEATWRRSTLPGYSSCYMPNPSVGADGSVTLMWR